MSLNALINATNRLAVITGQPGNHQPGQSGKPKSPCVEGTS
jgi:hypothetical protein